VISRRRSRDLVANKHIPVGDQGITMKRREVLAGVGTAAVVGTTGCLGVVGMDEHEASPGGVDPAVREQTGYEQTNIEEITIRETVERMGISEEITVRNYLTRHEKSVELGPAGSVSAATFAVLSSPRISIAGRALNPIREMSARELVDLVESNLERINNVNHVEDRETTILDEETVEGIFEGETQLQGFTIDLRLHVTESVQAESDHLVTIGGYPRRLRDSEEEDLRAMMDGVVPSIE
jgi:hypothetical protein